MATKRSKGTIQNIVDAIGELMRQPLSDQSDETPGPAAVRKSKRVAAGPRRKAKKSKRASRKKARPAARKKKR
jgi:L-serine deaminase